MKISVLAQPGDLGDALRRVASRKLLQFSETGGVLFDVVAIDQVVADQDVRDAVEQRQIRPRLQRQMKIRHHRGLRDARIGHDQRLVAIGFQILAEDRMIVGDVRADQQDHVGRLHVFVSCREGRRCRTRACSRRRRVAMHSVVLPS